MKHRGATKSAAVIWIGLRSQLAANGRLILIATTITICFAH